MMRSATHLLTVQAYLAVGDIRSAKDAYTPILTFNVTDGLSRPAKEFAAVKLRMQLEGYPTDVVYADVERVLRLHLLGRGMGAGDFAAGTLFRALFCIGRESQALQLFTEYVTSHRRDCIPFEHELASFMDFAGVTISPGVAETHGG